MHQKSCGRVAGKRGGPGRRLHDIRDCSLQICQGEGREFCPRNLRVTVSAKAASVFQRDGSGYSREEKRSAIGTPFNCRQCHAYPKRDGTPLVMAFGRERVFLYLPHPAGPKKKCFVDWVRKEKLKEVQGLLTNSSQKNGTSK